MRGLESLTHGVRNLETQNVLLGNITQLTIERQKEAEEKLKLASNEIDLIDAFASIFGYTTKNAMKFFECSETLDYYASVLNSYHERRNSMKGRVTEMIHEHLDNTDDPLYAALHELKQEAWEMKIAMCHYNTLLDAASKHGDGADPGMLVTGDVLKAQKYFGRGNDLDILVDLREAIKDVDQKLWVYEMHLEESAKQLSKLKINPELHLNLNFTEVPENEFFKMKFMYTDYFAAKDYPQTIQDVPNVQKAMTELNDVINKQYASATGNMNNYIAHIYAQCSGRPLPDLSKIREELKMLEKAAFGK
jgi:hypothetical protein